MYISSNWILAKALRTALSVAKGGEGLDREKGGIQATAKRAVTTAGRRPRESWHTELPLSPGRSQDGLSVGVSDPPSAAEILEILRDKAWGSKGAAALVALD